METKQHDKEARMLCLPCLTCVAGLLESERSQKFL